MDQLIGESVEQRKFGHLPEMSSDSPFQLGTLASESFSEWIISMSNILIDVRHIRLDHENIDKMIVLHMSERLM